MSENVRVCQFYLRGRCHREKCEFRHPANVGSGLSQNKIKESIASETVRRFNYKSEDEPNDSSDDSDEVRDRSRIRVEREKVRRRPTQRVQRGLSRRKGSQILERDRKIIKQELQKSKASSATDTIFEQSKVPLDKDTRTNNLSGKLSWVPVPVTCSKCKQSIICERRKSV